MLENACLLGKFAIVHSVQGLGWLISISIVMFMKFVEGWLGVKLVVTLADWH